jgi:hypothetical protein
MGRWHRRAVDRPIVKHHPAKQERDRHRLSAVGRSADQPADWKCEPRCEAKHLQSIVVSVVQCQSVHVDWRHNRRGERDQPRYIADCRRHREYVHPRGAGSRAAAAREPPGRDQWTNFILVHFFIQRQWPAVERVVGANDLVELLQVGPSSLVLGSWSLLGPLGGGPCFGPWSVLGSWSFVVL